MEIILIIIFRRDIKTWSRLKFGYNFVIKCEGVVMVNRWNGICTRGIICLLIWNLPNDFIGRKIKLLTMMELMINEWLDWVYEGRDNTGYWFNPFKSYWSGIMKTIGNFNDKNCD